jgi:hypothetical protein
MMIEEVEFGYFDGMSVRQFCIDCPVDHLSDFQRFDLLGRLHICWFVSYITHCNCSLVLELSIIWSNCCNFVQMGMLGRRNMMFVQVAVGLTDGITERPVCIDCLVDHLPDFQRFD